MVFTSWNQIIASWQRSFLLCSVLAVVSYHSFIVVFFLQVSQTNSFFLDIVLVRQFIALFFFLEYNSVPTMFQSHLIIYSSCQYVRTCGALYLHWPTAHSSLVLLQAYRLFFFACKQVIGVLISVTGCFLFYVAPAFETNANNVIIVTVFFL